MWTLALSLLIALSSAEIRVKKDEIFTAPFDGVFIGDKAYREFVFLDEQYEILKISHVQLRTDFERYKERSTDQLWRNQQVWKYMLSGVLIGMIGGFYIGNR